MVETTEVDYGRVSPVTYVKNDAIYKFLDMICVMMIKSRILLLHDIKTFMLLVLPGKISHNDPTTSYLTN